MFCLFIEGKINFVEDICEYVCCVECMKKIFIDNGFYIVYDYDVI